MRDITRRGFVAGSAIAAGLVGLAGCSAGGNGAAASDPLAAPAEDKYPIDPDKDDVKAKWASEQTRDGWYKVTNEDGGAVAARVAAGEAHQAGGDGAASDKAPARDVSHGFLPCSSRRAFAPAL